MDLATLRDNIVELLSFDATHLRMEVGAGITLEATQKIAERFAGWG
jgi:hypothetical protein